MIRRLEDLVAPLSEREFLDSFSRKRRLVVKTTEPERAASLLPWATINHLIDGRNALLKYLCQLEGKNLR